MLKLLLVLVILVLAIVATVKSKKVMDSMAGNEDAKCAYKLNVAVTVLLAVLLVWCVVMHVAEKKGYNISSLSHYL